MPVCTKCRVEKPENEFYFFMRKVGRDAGTKRRQPRCKVCQSVATKSVYARNGKAFYLKHREKLLARSKKWVKDNNYDTYAKVKLWRANHPEESRIRDARYKQLKRVKIRNEFVEKLFAAYGNKCVKCGVPRSDTWPLIPDHVTPVSKGGLNRLGNLQPLCTRCNGKKRSAIIDYRFDKGDLARALEPLLTQAWELIRGRKRSSKHIFDPCTPNTAKDRADYLERRT